MDTEKGISGNCDSFDPNWIVRAVTYKVQSPKYVIKGEDGSGKE